jgi:hypothetical protein
MHRNTYKTNNLNCILYKPSPCNRVTCEKLIKPQLNKKFSTFHGPLRLTSHNRSQRQAVAGIATACLWLLLSEIKFVHTNFVFQFYYTLRYVLKVVFPWPKFAIHSLKIRLRQKHDTHNINMPVTTTWILNNKFKDAEQSEEPCFLFWLNCVG